MPRADANLSRVELVARRFGARAAHYDEHALLQREAAANLVAFIEETGGLGPDLKPGLVVEIGCGTGLLSERLAPLAGRYLATDIAPEMLERCRQRLGQLPQASFAVADGESITFDEPPAAIVTNLAAQWFVDPVAGLLRLAGHTACLAFAVPLAGSFPEWREAFLRMGREPGLLPMPRANDVLRALTGIPGTRTRFKTESHTLRYANARAFADSFRNIGADQPKPGYRPGPIRPVLKCFAQGMEATAFVLYGVIRKEDA
ncbi:methyltransferase domain-containing protein [Humidesulfovibrio sp.]